MQPIDTLRERINSLGASDQAFARSLLNQAQTRGLSDKQMAWVTKLVDRATKPKPTPIDVREIVTFLANAKIKRPQIIFAIGEEDIRLSIAGPGSRTPGHINVTSADRAYTDRRFYGRIGPDGMFDPSLSLDTETQTAIVAALKAFAADPAGVAARYGHMMGSCCFCRITLTDDRSVKVGYGKTCARKYGLPYGTV
jgi:hypothetical protein